MVVVLKRLTLKPSNIFTIFMCKQNEYKISSQLWAMINENKENKAYLYAMLYLFNLGRLHANMFTIKPI